LQQARATKVQARARGLQLFRRILCPRRAEHAFLQRRRAQRAQSRGIKNRVGEEQDEIFFQLALRGAQGGCLGTLARDPAPGQPHPFVAQQPRRVVAADNEELFDAGPLRRQHGAQKNRQPCQPRCLAHRRQCQIDQNRFPNHSPPSLVVLTEAKDLPSNPNNTRRRN